MAIISSFPEKRGLNTDDINDIANGEISNGFVQSSECYSTTEQVIGKWIDGKPLYQRTWDTTLASGSIFTLGSDILPKKLEVSMFYNDKSLQSNSFFYEGNNRWCVYIDNNDVRGIVPLSAYEGRKIAITIQYTKTTD